MEETIVLLSREGQTRILGLSLVERLILYGQKAGLRKFWLYSEEPGLASQVLEKLRSDRRFSPEKMELAVCRTEDIARSGPEKNGSSPVLVLEDKLVVHPDFFTSIIRANGQEPGQDLILLSPNGSSATEQTGRVGAFLVNRERIGNLLPALVSSAGTGPDGLEKIKDSISVGRLEVDCPFAVRVDGPETARQAEKLLLETGRKPVDGYITRVWFRPISLRLTRHLIRWGLTPNQISLIVLAVELLSVYLIFQGQYGSMALGSFLFLAASVIDCCDGENARLTCRVSRFGTIFDISADAFLYVTFFTALPLGLYRGTSSEAWLYVGAFGWLSMVGFYLQMIHYARRAGIGFNIVPIAREIETSIHDPDFQTWADRLASRIAFIYRRDFFTTLAFVLIALGGARLLAIMVSFFAFLEAVYFGSWSRRQLRKKALNKLQPA
ncbi:MAG: CTP:Inositol-1-phosphate cytidylyltransferase [Candidatus Saccharicenans subterraneus]|uniref:CTP:Inositol-1-phosphate cytidylyltransferase n=1 Tax=Candidatus Saccharicenans subterraneus TaxID=2508984 RepID=A0A3E2BLU9_9BACT|nr:MAG: CTP:Inositol-1-phosphate cytidylyltransferase [Candidatus Saccharicenans subterraneum]